MKKVIKTATVLYLGILSFLTEGMNNQLDNKEPVKEPVAASESKYCFPNAERVNINNIDEEYLSCTTIVIPLRVRSIIGDLSKFNNLIYIKMASFDLLARLCTYFCKCKKLEQIEIPSLELMDFIKIDYLSEIFGLKEGVILASQNCQIKLQKKETHTGGKDYSTFLYYFDVFNKERNVFEEYIVKENKSIDSGQNSFIGSELAKSMKLGQETSSKNQNNGFIEWSLEDIKFRIYYGISYFNASFGYRELMRKAPGKTLSFFLNDKKNTKEEKEKMLYNVGLGIAYLHKRGFSHNDFNKGNVIVGNDIISIIDLEYSSIENMWIRLKNKLDNSSCGTFNNNCVIEYNPEAYRKFWSGLDPFLKMSNDYDPYVNDICRLTLGLKNNEILAVIKGYLQVRFDIGFINTVRKYFSSSIVESMNQYMKNKLREMYISPYLKSIFSKGVFTTFDYNLLTRIVMPNTVTAIDNFAFRGTSNLREIYLPLSLTKIGDHAFEGCINLKKADLPPILTSIGEFAFSGCSELKQIEIPETVTNIGNSAFSLCPRLSRVSTTPNITAIGNGQVWKKIYISSNVNVIDREFFMNCNFNRSNKVIIPDTVTAIADYAFRDFSDLTQIHLPPSITKIGDFAFIGCINLKKINLPTALTSIGKFAFLHCLELEQMKIPRPFKDEVQHENYQQRQDEALRLVSNSLTLFVADC